MSEVGSVMAEQRPALNVTSRYEDFLFARICDEPGGMQLSVLSALARMNVDPWEEAARLATMSTSDAERTLVSTLNLLPGQRHSSPETEILAARLVALLPKARTAATTKVATTTGGHGQRMSYWLVWLCIAIVMSFLSPPQHATTTSAGDSASTSNAAPPTESSDAGPALSDANGRAAPGEVPAAAPPAGLTAR